MITEFCLFHEDCIEGMRRMEPGSVDLVVTSPPYNIGVDYGNYNDRKSKADYLSWTFDWTNEVRRVLADDGSFFLNIGGSPSNPLLPHEVIIRLRDLFVLQNTIHWIKSITVTTPSGSEISAGHFKPINSKRYLNNCHEYVFHLTKTGQKPINRLSVGVAYMDKTNIRRWRHTGGNDKRCRGNAWYIPYETIQRRDLQRPHPATFPVGLPEMCIRLHGQKTCLTMLDPFLGIGHSAIAAKHCGVRKFYGFEIEKEFLDLARRTVEVDEAMLGLG
jgi:site-specific DNA-methyltransferase (adenine-specific)